MNNPYYQNNGNPYLQVASARPNGYGPYGKRPISSICDVLNKCGKRVDAAARKAEVFADNVWHHLKVSSSLTDAAMARISQGTKILAEGGHDKVFQQAFGNVAGEKLIKAFVCYFSTSSGPAIGTLYISTKRVVFCSDYPFYSCSSTTGQQQWMYYKVVVQLDKLKTVNPCSSRTNPSEKYIQIGTTDGHDFWFMGFMSYDKALKQLTEALQRTRDSSRDIRVSSV
ncbi:GEM-like protein 1 isoform X3 [Mercurialis annua]|nr:GEM-like protein 1 isoform X3 [Mercurialis annua]